MTILTRKLSFVAALLFVIIGIFFANPESTSAACVINDVNIRPNGVQPLQISDVPGPDDFPNDGFLDNNRPNVYMDIQTSGCQGSTLGIMVLSPQFIGNLAVLTEQSWVLGTIASWFFDPYAVGEFVYIGTGTPQVPGHNTMNDSFTVALKSGETSCVIHAGYDCNYAFLTYGSTGVTPYIMGTQNLPELMYECDGACNVGWTYMGIHDYGSTFGPSNGGGSVPFSSGDYFTEGYDDLLAPLPGFTESSSPTLGEFLRSLFTVLIMLAGILAFIMLVIGGITYATADSIGGTSGGKDMMLNAVLGLIIALGAWVILNTINPNLASNLSITIPKVTFDDASPEWQDGNAPVGTVITSSSANLGGQAITQGMPWPSDTAQRGQLAAAGITVNTPNDCSPTAGGTGCTSLYFEGEAAGVIDQIIAFKNLCNCEIVITGGSEAWLHRTHGPNKKVIDMRATPSLNAYLRGLPGNPVPGNDFPSGKTITVQGFGSFYAEPPASTSNTTAPHWHITFI